MTTVLALNLLATVGMHPFVAAEIGKLGVGLQANFTLEWLDTAVDVLVLLQPAGCGKCFATLVARVATRPNVRGPNVALQVAGVCKHLVTVLTGKVLQVTTAL